jgi:hypothetical protein
MSSNISCQFPTIWLLTSVGEQYKPVNTVIGAADILLYEWPPTVGKAYVLALETCLNALQENEPATHVPEALMRAADEAFICYIHVIGGGKRPHGQQSVVSRSQHFVPKELVSGFQC